MRVKVDKCGNVWTKRRNDLCWLKAGIQLKIWDNKGETIDRYTVQYTGIGRVLKEMRGWAWCVACDSRPFHPAGFCQHDEIALSKFVGDKRRNRIWWSQLPRDVKKVVRRDLTDIYKKR